MISLGGSYRRKNRSFTKKNRTGAVRTGRVKTSKVNKRQKIIYQRHYFAGYMDQAAAMISMKQRGTYDPRKDPGSQLNRTGTATKEEKRWIKYHDSGKQGKSPYEIMNPTLAPGSTIITKTTSVPLSDVESARLEKLEKYREKLRLNEFSNYQNEKLFNEQYSDKNLLKMAKFDGEMEVGIDNYNSADKKAMDYIRERLPPEKRSLFDQSPKSFIDARLRYEGTWVPREKRTREEQRKANRRKELEREYPDAISWWIPARMKDDGDFESTFSIERKLDGSFNLKDLHNSKGGAWHSGKYLAETRASRHPDFYKRVLTTDEIRNHLRKEIVGVVEVAQVGSAKHTIESKYSYLKPGERETISMTLDPKNNAMKGKEILLQTTSIRIGQLKPSDIKRETEFLKRKLKSE